MKKIVGFFKNPAEFYTLILLFLIALYFFITAFGFSPEAKGYPILTSSATMIFIILYFVEVVFTHAKKHVEYVAAEEKPANKPYQQNSFRTVGITIICLVSYLVVTYLIGFLLASAILAAVYPLLFGYRKPIKVILCCISAIVIVLCFQSFLSITLCRGQLLDLTRFFF